jgi:hypothetical protein
MFSIALSLRHVADHFDYWLMLINEVNRHLFLFIYYFIWEQIDTGILFGID